MIRLLVLMFAAAHAHADAGDEAVVILGRVLANRPTKDFSLKARLFVDRETTVPVQMFIKHGATETRTVYRTGKTEAMILQPEHGDARIFLRGSGEVSGARRLERLADSQFTYYDLALPFLRWRDLKFEGQERIRGRNCHLIEGRASGEPYARVKMWIDKEYYAVLRVEAYDEHGTIIKRFAITSFKKIDEVWVPRGLEIVSYPPGQALPAGEKSRLEVYDGDYDAALPAEWFSLERFGPASDAGGGSP